MKYNLFYLILLLCLVACKNDVTDSASQSNTPQLNIKIVEARRQDVPLKMEFIGRVEGATDLEIRARVDGEIKAIHFEEGKPVTVGQLLYEIDDAPYQEDLNKAKAGVAEAEARYVRADSDLKRIKPLSEINAVSKRDLDLAISNFEASKQGVIAAKATEENAKIILGYTKITAPIAGVIGLSKAKVGEYVGAAPNPVILNTISDLSSVSVKLSVTEKEYLHFAKITAANAKEGTPQEKKALTLTLADGSIYQHKGSTKSVDRNIDAKSGTLAVDTSFPNPEGLLKPGLFAKVSVVADTLKDVVVIPNIAIRELQGLNQVVSISEAGVVQLKLVELGNTIGNLRVITSGLEAGTKIATDNLMKLRDGMTVNATLTQF